MVTALTPVAVGQKLSAALFNLSVTAIQEAQTAVSQLQSANTLFNYSPSSATTSPTGSTPGVWLSLGTITVPAWATQAYVALCVGGVYYSAAATGGNTNVSLHIGSNAGPSKRIGPDPGGTTQTRFNYVANLLVPVSPGPQPVTIYTTSLAGVGYNADASSNISGLVTFSL